MPLFGQLLIKKGKYVFVNNLIKIINIFNIFSNIKSLKHDVMKLGLSSVIVSVSIVAL